MSDIVGTSLWTEPASPASAETPPVYPYNNITQTDSGHTFEMDDTPDRERIRLTHRVGSFIEMHPNGDEVHKIRGTGYEIVANGKNVMITGDCNITVIGNANFLVEGNKTETINGDYTLEVTGDLKIRSKNDIKILGDKYVSISADRSGSGTMSISAGSSIFMNGNMNVNGSITGDLITSLTRVDAVTGINAGFEGFFTTGPVTAATGQIGILGTIQAFDVMNGTRYNFHTHPAPHGVTGITTAPFLPVP